MVLEAFRLALKYMTPVIVLSDGGLSNASEPWKMIVLASLMDDINGTGTNLARATGVGLWQVGNVVKIECKNSE